MHTDIPTRSEIEALLDARDPSSVTLYTPTSQFSQEGRAGRIAFKNQVAAAAALLREAGTAEADVAAFEESLGDLEEDYDFWSVQANSLAVFATPTRLRTYRLPNRIAGAVRVADRFAVMPLLRTVSFPQAAFVLALAQGSARLVEIAADGPAFAVEVPDMPPSVAGAVRKASIADRTASGRVQGSEGQKVRMRQYARAVDRALRGVLAGRDQPLILACTPPLDAIFREVNSHPHLVERGIRGNPETLSDTDLTLAGRAVLDGVYAEELAALRELLATRAEQGRSATDPGDVARAATHGAVDTLLVDMDAHLAGTVDAATGAVSPATASDGDGTGVTEEIARRTLRAGGRVVAVRADDLPTDSPVAAVLRYPA